MTEVRIPILGIRGDTKVSIAILVKRGLTQVRIQILETHELYKENDSNIVQYTQARIPKSWIMFFWISKIMGSR